MIIKLLKDCEVPMARWYTACECCGPTRDAEDFKQWHPAGTELDPETLYNEINLEAHKDVFKFGEHYTIIKFP